MPRLRSVTAIVLALVLCSSAWAGGVTFRVVDADTGQGVPNVSVKRLFRYSGKVPYSISGSLWFSSGPELKTDSSGIVRCQETDSDVRLNFEADGYILVQISKDRFRLKISSNEIGSDGNYENSSSAKKANGVIIVPIRHKKAE